MLGAIKKIPQALHLSSPAPPAATIESSPPSDPVDFVVVNNTLGILKWQQQYVPIPMYKDTLPVVKGEEFTVLPRKEVVLKDTFSDSRYERHLMVTSILDVLKVNVLVYDLTGKPNNEKLFVYPGPPPEMLAVTYEDELRLNLVRANAAGNLEALKVILLDTSPRLLEQAVVELLSIPNLGLAFIEKRVISLVKGKLPGDIPIRIRHGPEDGLCQDEINARTQRFAQVRKALNIPDDSIQPPCIAIASSGGGMRAMVSAAGFYAALKAMKVLDAATYVASLSGSTWTASKWMNVSPNPWAKYTNQPPSLPDCWSSDVPPEDQENLDVSSLIKVATKSIWPNAGESIGKIILKFSIMAGYSCMLAHKMEVEDLFTLKTSPASTGLVPIPIYTACFPDTPKSFQWQEFTPYEIGGTFLQTFFSIDHLTIEDAGGTPPYLHDLMAVWGSAYNATFVQIMQNFNINVPDWLQYVLGNSSLPGSGMVNPNYNRVDPSTGKPLPLANHKKVFLRDGGILANLPLPPLLRPERTVDLIIVLDASSTIEKTPFLELKKAIPSIQLPSPPYQYPVVFPKTEDYPQIIYIPVIQSSGFSDPSFDPEKSCGTLDFDYDENTAKSLENLAYYWTMSAKDQIMKCMSSSA